MTTCQLKWKTIDDVPHLTIMWAQSVSNDPHITINDIIELVSSYENWIDNQSNERYYDESNR